MKDFSRYLENHISDELLAAYIDGETTKEENELIDKSINEDSILSEIHDIVNDSISFGSGFDWELHKDDFGFWELGLPPLVIENEIDNWQNCSNNLIDSNMTDMFNMQMRIYGEAGENVTDPIFIQQPDDHSCALRSQQIVLRDFGIDIPFDKLEQIALDNGVYTNEGTYTYDIGKVLELAGVSMHQVIGSTMYDLMNELAQGHRVIVSVDAYELWNNDSAYGRLKNWFDDVFGNQGGNHALIVAGVEVNPNDINDIKVVLTDPGAGHLRIEYPVEQFMDAWKDSNCFMVATDNPAPYQYDASTGMEVPSNFAVQQHFNQFIAENSYQLSPDLINIPNDYQPAFTGHLDMVGNMSYESFEEELCDHQSLNSTLINIEDGDDVFSHRNSFSTFDHSSSNEDEHEDDEELKIDDNRDSDDYRISEDESEDFDDYNNA